MTEYRFVQYERAGSLVTVRISRPPYNVLDIATMEELDDALGRATAEPDAKLLLVTGAGEKAFSSGVDVLDHTRDKVERMLAVFHGMLGRLRGIPFPTVAAVNGAALGGGCELAIACDMVLAAEGAKIGQPEIRLGVFPPVAAILMPGILPMAKVMELLLGGAAIDAREAHRLGLVNHVLPKESFAADTAKYLEQFLGLSKPALVFTKRAIREASGKPFHEALSHVEQLYLKELMATEDASEGLNAFMEKRRPVWKDR